MKNVFLNFADQKMVRNEMKRVKGGNNPGVIGGSGTLVKYYYCQPYSDGPQYFYGPTLADCNRQCSRPRLDASFAIPDLECKILETYVFN
jgi:hypothetical protein